jgi:hypothetical protein
MLTLTSVSAFADENTVIITIDSKQVEFDDSTGIPFVDENCRTQVPFRVTLEKFGATVDWDSEECVAIATKGDITVEIPIGEDYILKNGVEISTDTTSRIVDSRTYLPIRKVMEAFGCDVQWDSDLKTVVVTTTPVDAKSILMEANTKSYDWDNYDTNITMDISVPVLDDAGTLQMMETNMNMYMTIFMNPLKIKMNTSMKIDAQGMMLNQPLMDMYMTVNDSSYTTYMGINDSTGTLTWTKTTIEDKSLIELMDKSKDSIEENIELIEKYTTNVKFLGKYADEDGKMLEKIQYTLSGDIYSDLLDGYEDDLFETETEEEAIAAEMIESIFGEGLSEITITTYIDEESGEITKYEMDISSIVKSMISSLSDAMEVSTEEFAALDYLQVYVTMEIYNVDTAEEFDIPDEALNAPEASELTPENESTVESEVTE